MMKIVNNVPNGQEYGVTLNLKVTLTALFVNVMMVSQGRGLRSLFDLHSSALDCSVRGWCCTLSAALLDPTLCKQPKICLKHQCLGHLQNVGSGNNAETVYSTTYKHCSLKLN